tara:strand:+ start:1079 stop:2047 length:969 start_codon:yes stop_codon:yes gene_type:complete
MNSKPILLVAGEPNSIFLEILFKTYRRRKIKKPLILICSYKLLVLQMKKLGYKKKIKIIDIKKIKKYKLDNKFINLIDVKYQQKEAFEKISSKSNTYIENCFKTAIKLINLGIVNNLINGPISKKYFLKNKFLGITEYLAKRSNKKNIAMLIFNKKLSVCPITTHLPLKKVSKKINKSIIFEKIVLIDNFFKKYFGYKPKIAITGLNPHCESIEKLNEDKRILEPAIRSLIKRKYRVSGPYSADTIFLKKNRVKFNVIVGMYHDQVLTPIKTLFEYDAINITLGLPFIRISPDHGPNEKMLGRNLSNPLSLIKAINFLEKIK